jgi:hypothetical protein
MELITKVILKMIRWKEREHYIMAPTELLMREVGSLTNSMDMEHFITKIPFN